MKKTIGLTLLLIALAGAVWYLTHSNQNDEMPASTSLYAIDDISRVYKVGLIYPDGVKVRLERTKDGWLYNGEKGNESVINTLLNTVRKQRILYATPASLKPTMLKSLATKKVKVEMYDKNDKLLQLFYVGAPSNDGNSTYFIKENSNEPHLVGIPGFVGTININYYRPTSDWVNKIIFKYSPDDIKAVSMEYPNHKNWSFKFSHKGDQFDVRPFYDITPPITKPLKLGAGNTYLSFYEKIGAEAYEPNISLRDSLNRLVPFATLTLTDKDNMEHQTKFYPFIPPGAGGIEYLLAKDRDPNSPIGVNRYFVINEDNHCYMTQHRVIGKVLWQYADFFDQ
ncbi:MAG TPA: hypothetical protein ENK85_00230 [Saprospiraceae bacterium]|nr:hypothetical protein [Saprospiraceae bacterium]